MGQYLKELINSPFKFSFACIFLVTHKKLTCFIYFTSRYTNFAGKLSFYFELSAQITGCDCFLNNILLEEKDRHTGSTRTCLPSNFVVLTTENLQT